MMLLMATSTLLIWLISLSFLVIVTLVLCLVNLAGFGRVRRTIEQIASSIRDRNYPLYV
jgi:hypothetical protein